LIYFFKKAQRSQAERDKYYYNKEIASKEEISELFDTSLFIPFEREEPNPPWVSNCYT